MEKSAKNIAQNEFSQQHMNRKKHSFRESTFDSVILHKNACETEVESDRIRNFEKFQ